MPPIWEWDVCLFWGLELTCCVLSLAPPISIICLWSLPKQKSQIRIFTPFKIILRLCSHDNGRIFVWLKNLSRHFAHTGPLNRAMFVWPWNENARTKKKQQTDGNRAIWLVYRTDKNSRGFCLVKRTLGWKIFMPENFLEINRYFALTSYCNTIGQSNNAFFSGKTKVIFSSFHPLADKTNNEHLPKPFFKVIRKSLHFRSVHTELWTSRRLNFREVMVVPYVRST